MQPLSSAAMGSYDHSSSSSSVEWLVARKGVVKGPIVTHRLLRGVAKGYIEEDCHVWRRGFETWRPVASIREVQTLRMAQAEKGKDWIPSFAWSPSLYQRLRVRRASAALERASDSGEIISLALSVLQLTTGASVGLAHRTTSTLGPLETRIGFGEVAMNRLGNRVGRGDPGLASAQLGARLIGHPHRTSAGTATAIRLGSPFVPLRGVALAPIRSRNRLVAVVELGHREHVFRQSDLAVLRAVTEEAGALVTRLS